MVNKQRWPQCGHGQVIAGVTWDVHHEGSLLMAMQLLCTVIAEAGLISQLPTTTAVGVDTKQTDLGIPRSAYVVSAQSIQV